MADEGRTIKVGVLQRLLEVSDFAIRKDEKDGLMRISFSASSEHPVERIFGTEILDHSAKAVRLDRIKSGTTPLLFNHRMADDPVGMIDSARIEGRRLVMDAHFFATARAQDVAKMVEGGLRNISIGYRIHEVVENVKEETYRITDWEPFEASVVAVPADPTIGIGRSAEDESFEVRILRSESTAAPAAILERSDMSQEKDAAAGSAEKQDALFAPTGGVPQAIEGARAHPAVEEQSRRNAQDIEQARVRAIANFAKANKVADSVRDAWVSQGYSLEEVSKDLLNILEERGRTNPQPASKLGMSRGEVQQFSLSRAIIAAATKDWKNAGFEMECSRAVAQRLNKVVDEHKFYVPFEVMERQVDTSEFNAQRALAALGRRDLTVATAGAGGYLVATDNVGFIEILRNRSVAFRMGVRRLSGLQGNVTVPRQSAAGTAYWLATEATDITESQQTFVQMALSPKNVGAYTEISRQLLIQSSPGAEGLVTDDLAKIVAVAADLSVLNGSGASGQPTGIIGTAGIGAVTGTTFDYADILEFQEDVATSNVEPVRGGYVTTPTVAKLAMTRVKFSSTASPLWEGNIWDGTMAGFPAMSSNQMPAGNMLFGDWQEIVVGEWGVLEVEVNPYANFKAGIIGVRAIYSLDVGVRRPFAFSLMTSAT
jgi:HK97 family phage major capsid protein/HK97 family phage prohead protease